MFRALQLYTLLLLFLFCLTICKCYLCIVIDVLSYNNHFKSKTFLARPKSLDAAGFCYFQVACAPSNL